MSGISVMGALRQPHDWHVDMCWLCIGATRLQRHHYLPGSTDTAGVVPMWSHDAAVHQTQRSHRPRALASSVDTPPSGIS